MDMRSANSSLRQTDLGFHRLCQINTEFKEANHSLSKPQFSPLKNGDNNTYLRIVERIKRAHTCECFFRPLKVQYCFWVPWSVCFYREI